MNFDPVESFITVMIPSAVSTSFSILFNFSAMLVIRCVQILDIETTESCKVVRSLSSALLVESASKRAPDE